MKRKLAKNLSHERQIDIYYNGGVEGAEGHECYRIHATLASNAERIQLQAFAAEASLEIDSAVVERERATLEAMPKEQRGEDTKKAVRVSAYVETNLEYQKKRNAYAMQGELPPDELYTRQVLARHIQRIEIVQGGDDGEEVFEAVFVVDGKELSWVEMDAAQRLDLVGLHIIMFAKITPVIIPSASSGVLGKSEMQRVKEGLKTQA